MNHGKLRGPVRKTVREQRITNKMHKWVKKGELAWRMKLWLWYQSSKKESREVKGSVKIWELDSDVNRDSFVEFDNNVSSNSLRPNWMSSMHSCSATLSFVCFLRQATLAFVSFFVLAILPDQLQEKPGPAATERLSFRLSALQNIRVSVEIRA